VISQGLSSPEPNLPLSFRFRRPAVHGVDHASVIRLRDPNERSDNQYDRNPNQRFDRHLGAFVVVPIMRAGR
jgi:hypothetical protein